ncbi:MAG: DUF4127 family protein [Oscillibacter sp.]|nr:DUF4127 family protein [Oscillibacter sp.]
MRHKNQQRQFPLRPFLVGLILLLLALIAWELVQRRLYPERYRDWSRVIAYVPLDDRIDNLEDVVYLAEASGWEIVMPPRDWFRTALDGQPPNENGTPYGNREALFLWVRDMGRAGCHTFILSLDQLFSGGLAHSRSVRETWPLSFSGRSAMGEIAAFRKYVLPLAKKPQNRLYLFDSLARLSPTVAYRGIGESEYYALREYGMVPRPILSDRELSLQRVFSLYPYAEDGRTPAENALENTRFRDFLTPDLLETYLGVRRRKLTLTDEVLSEIDGLSNVQLFIGVDDSSNRDNIQYNELRYLRSRIGDDVSSGVAVMAGLDSLARMFVGRAAQETYGYRVRASVRYIGGTQDKHSSEFDLYTLEEVVKRHLDFFRAEQVPERDAELQFLVMTAPENPEQAAEYVEELVSTLERNLALHIPTVLNEASNDAYGDTLEQALLQRAPFAGLVAYAGKYDQANVTGAAFAMGFSRYLYLRCDGTGGTPVDLAQLRQMANSMALTEYILHTRAPLNAYLKSLHVDTGNIPYNTPHRERIEQKLTELFAPECQKVRDNLQDTALLCALMPWSTKKVRTVSFHDYRLPWNRTFELSFTIDVSVDEP